MKETLKRWMDDKKMVNAKIYYIDHVLTCKGSIKGFDEIGVTLYTESGNTTNIPWSSLQSIDLY